MDDVVPTCEGWEVRDLAVHVGQFCGFWRHVLCEGIGSRPKPLPDPPEDDDSGPVGSRRPGRPPRPARGHPADAPRCGRWFEIRPVRRVRGPALAHELAVHRYDAQSARGICTPIPAELAADGIDEVLDVLVTARDAAGAGQRPGAVASGRSELGSEWSVTPRARSDRGGRGATRTRPPVEGGDLVVSGTTSDLELTLYHRPTLSPVDVHGDYTVLEEWHRRFTF